MRTPPHPLPPFGAVLVVGAATLGLGLSLLFALLTLPILALFRLAPWRASTPQNRRHPC